MLRLRDSRGGDGVTYETSTEIVEAHWRHELAFGVALKMLQEQFDMEQDAACDILFPPMGEGPMDSDVPVPNPPMTGYAHIPWSDRETRMLADMKKEEE